jgi:hypothetical protein
MKLKLKYFLKLLLVKFLNIIKSWNTRENVITCFLSTKLSENVKYLAPKYYKSILKQDFLTSIKSNFKIMLVKDIWCSQFSAL